MRDDEAMTARTVGILAFDDMEVLDHAGPYEVFNVAGELSEPSAFSVSAIGVGGRDTATGRGGFTVVPAHVVGDGFVPDVLVVPGGSGTRALVPDPRIVGWLREAAERVEVLVSVCTGSLLLASAGLLEGRRATTHHTAFDELASLDATIDVVRDERFVRSSPDVWTSGGISAVIDLALRVVEELCGAELRDAVVEEMEWGWHA